ncbi:MAG: type I glutamate--ammonia ligase [Ferrimicrobium sp.]
MHQEHFLEVDEGELTATEARLRAQGVDAVALTYVDNASIVRTKAIPLNRLGAALRHGVGMSPVFDAFLFNDAITESPYSGGPMGDLRLFPDLSSLRPLGAQPGWAWAPVDRYTQDDLPHPSCSRLFLTRQLKALGEMGATALMAFEVEWVVSNGVGDAFDPATHSPAYGFDRILDLSDYSRAVMVALANSGVSVEQFHPEYAPSQFEVSVAPSDPISASDTAVLVRATIRAVGRSYGLRTSFAPVVEVSGVGNGGHLHVSLYQEQSPIFAGGEGLAGLTESGESVLATLLSWLPALCAVGSPSPASYLRLVPSHWAGAFQCWGVENREAALRLVSQSALVKPSAANLEIKCFDLAANPYLVAGAVLAAARYALDHPQSAPEPIEGDPVTMEGLPRLPKTLTEAISHFRANSELVDAFGPHLATSFLAVKEAEIAHFAQAPPDQIVAETRWRY